MDTFAPLHATNARRLSRDDLDAVVSIDARLEGHTRRTYFERRLAAAFREPDLHIHAIVTPGLGAGTPGFSARGSGHSARPRDRPQPWSGN